MYEVKQSIDRKGTPRAPVAPIDEVDLGTFDALEEAIAVARTARDIALAGHTDDYMWWTVKEPGAQLASWISDSRSSLEYVLDLRSGQLIALNPR